jgi:glutamine amidotransferase
MIGIIDYGLGNINAFANIYRRLHVPCKRLSDPSDFEGVDKLILPGVGAFDHAMKTFSDSGLREITTQKVLDAGMPVIGICVGMQMLADSSEEGQLPGLGWIPGEVRKFDESRILFATRLPHMGWNDVESDTQSPVFKDFPSMSRFYFLHSYYFNCADSAHAIAWSDYGGRFSCAVARKNIFGVQFHPEKSHHFGVQLLENFSKITC